MPIGGSVLYDILPAGKAFARASFSHTLPLERNIPRRRIHRRRQHFPDDIVPCSVWKTMSLSAGAHPGDTRRPSGIRTLAVTSTND